MRNAFKKFVKTLRALEWAFLLWVLLSSGAQFGWAVTWYLIKVYMELVVAAAAVLGVYMLIDWYYNEEA